MATEHILRLKAQVDVSQAEAQLNKLQGKGAKPAGGSGSGDSSISLNQALRSAGFFAAARQFEQAAAKINAAAGEMRSAVADAMNRIGTFGLQSFAAGGAKGGAVGLAAGSAIAAIDYFVQTLAEQADSMQRQLDAQNQASREANSFVAMVDAAKASEELAAVLKGQSVPALEELKRKYDSNIAALQQQIDAAYDQAKRTNSLGANTKDLLTQIEKEKTARDSLVEAIDKQKKAEQDRLQKFVDTQQSIAQNRRDSAALGSNDIQRMQNMLAVWEQKAQEATAARDATGLQQAASMVDRYKDAIQRAIDLQAKEAQLQEDQRARQQTALGSARSNWIENYENQQLLSTGSLQKIILAIRRYKGLMEGATDASQFTSAARWLDLFAAKAQQMQEEAALDTMSINQSVSSLRQKGIYMGETAVAAQAEDYTRKTSDTVTDIKELVKKVVEQQVLQTEELKNSGKLG